MTKTMMRLQTLVLGTDPDPSTFCGFINLHLSQKESSLEL